MKKLILLIIFATSLQACGLLWEYRSINELNNMAWLASDQQHFDFNLEQDGDYEIIIMIRHLHGFAIEKIPVELKLSSSDTLYDQHYEIPVRDAAGEYLGEGGGDLWDLDFSAIQSIPLNKGSYHAEISQISEYDELRLIMEVGIMVKKVK